MVVSGGSVSLSGNLAATIMDNTTANVPNFILCTSASNPAVAAAFGVPQSCSPVLTAPWAPGKSNILRGGDIALDSDSTLNCAYGGTISVEFAGEVLVNFE